MTKSMLAIILGSLPITNSKETFIQDFLEILKRTILKFLEDIEYMLTQFYMHNDTCSRFKSSTTLHCVARIQIVKITSYDVLALSACKNSSWKALQLFLIKDRFFKKYNFKLWECAVQI